MASAAVGLGMQAMTAQKKAAEQKGKEKGAQRAEAGFMQSLTGPSEELAAQKEAIERRGTAGQEQAAAQLGAQLAKGGVRGGQAGVLQARSAGELGQSMQDKITQMALGEAQRQRDIKAQFLGQSAQAAQQRAMAGAGGGQGPGGMLGGVAGLFGGGGPGGGGIGALMGGGK